MNDPKTLKGRGCADSVHNAITSRRSIRAFLSDPVPDTIIRDILQTAARAPSGSNTQPWKIYVMRDAVRQALSDEIMAAYEAGEEHQFEYSYYAKKWREPYLARRRANGWGLYGAIGITKGDIDRMKHQHGRNYLFFDAPVGLIFTIDRDMEIGSWLDYGMFLQSVMLAARGHGLDTCSQQALAQYHKIIQKRLAIPEVEMIICGMALGYADMSAPENSYITDREPLDVYAKFIENLA